MSTIKRISFTDGYSSLITPAETVIGASSFLVGSGVPSSGLGNDGDVYLDSATGNLYEKASGSWSVDSQISLPASQVINTPAGNIAATDVQAAINELDTEKLDKTGGTISGNLIVSGDLQVDGTTTTLNTATLDVEDANITINNGGNQASADSQDAGITVEMSDATDCSIGYDSTLASKFKVGEVGSEVEIADVSTAQNISNKSIQTPSRLDVKQDTEANLTTYASTASNGQMCFATDTKQMYQVLDSALAVVGGGGTGSLDIFHTEDFETTIAADFTTGNNATFDNGGTIDGTLSDDTTTELSGTTSLKYVMSTASTNDFVKSPLISLDSKQAGNTVGIQGYYTYDGDDDDIKFVVYDDTGSEVLTSDVDFVKAASNPTRFSISIYIPTTSTSLAYGFQVVTGNSTKIFILDDIEISTNPFVAKDMLESESALYQQYAAYSSSNTKVPYFTNEKSNTISKLGVINNESVNGWSFTATKRCKVNISLSTAASGGTYAGLDLNGSELDTSVNSLTDDSTLVAFSYQSGSSSGDALTFNGIMEVGDVIVPHLDGAAVNTNEHRVHLSIVVTSETEHIITYNSKNAANLVVEGAGGGGTVLTANVTDVTFTEVTDTGGNGNNWDGSVFTAPEDGIYHFTGMIRMTSSSGNSFDMYKNTINYRMITTVVSTAYKQFSETVSLLKSDTISIRSDTGVTLSTSTTDHHISITKLGVGDLLGVPKPLVGYIKDEKASGTNGGTATSGAWRTRDLNTTSGDFSKFGSLSANQFTLDSGIYDIRGFGSAYSCNSHKVKIVSDPSGSPVDAIIGTTSYNGTSSAQSGFSEIIGKLIVTASTTFEFQHRVETTVATVGFGNSSSLGVVEVFSQIKITKLA